MENLVIEPGRLIYAKSHLLGGFSGALNGLAANAVMGAIRNAGPSEIVVDSCEYGFGTTAAASAGTQSLMIAMYKVEQFTALTNAGARATPPVAVRKRSNDCRALTPANDGDPKFETAVECQVGATTPLTGLTVGGGGIVVSDPQDVLLCDQWNNAAAGAFFYSGQKKWQPANLIPLVLAPNEGIVFATRLAFGTGLAGNFWFVADLRLS